MCLYVVFTVGIVSFIDTECTKHWEHIFDIELHPLLLSKQPQFVRAWTLFVKSVPQGCSPILTPMLPTVVGSWLDVLWVGDRSWYTQKTVEHEKNVLGTRKQVRLSPITITHSKALKYFVFTLNGTQSIPIISGPQNPSLSFLHWLKCIEQNDTNKGA
jgi:hypothetical protein